MNELTNPITEILTKLTDVNYYYLFSQVLCVYGILKYLIKTPKKWVKISVSLVVGTILFVVFYMLDKANIQQLIYTFFVSTVLYNWIIKGIMNKIGDTYNNNKGII